MYHDSIAIRRHSCRFQLIQPPRVQRLAVLLPFCIGLCCNLRCYSHSRRVHLAHQAGSSYAVSKNSNYFGNAEKLCTDFHVLAHMPLCFRRLLRLSEENRSIVILPPDRQMPQVWFTVVR